METVVNMIHMNPNICISTSHVNSLHITIKFKDWEWSFKRKRSPTSMLSIRNILQWIEQGSLKPQNATYLETRSLQRELVKIRWYWIRVDSKPMTGLLLRWREISHRYAHKKAGYLKLEADKTTKHPQSRHARTKTDMKTSGTE
jgi:hypothetical protein